MPQITGEGSVCGAVIWIQDTLQSPSKVLILSFPTTVLFFFSNRKKEEEVMNDNYEAAQQAFQNVQGIKDTGKGRRRPRGLRSTTDCRASESTPLPWPCSQAISEWMCCQRQVEVMSVPEQISQCSCLMLYIHLKRTFQQYQKTLRSIKFNRRALAG